MLRSQRCLYCGVVFVTSRDRCYCPPCHEAWLNAWARFARVCGCGSYGEKRPLKPYGTGMVSRQRAKLGKTRS